METNVDKDIQKRNLDFIATGNDILIRLPEFIRLQDPLPREPRMLRKRKKPAVLRFHKANKDNQYDRWMLQELMLYTHFRASDLEDYETRSSELYEEKRNWITKVKSIVMEHLENVEEARYMVEQSTKEVNLDEIGYDINAAHEQE